MELTFPNIPENYTPPKANGHKRVKIEWTPEMLQHLSTRFATEFNKAIAKDLCVSWRSIVRKARELGLEKEPQFLDKKRGEIVELIKKVRKPHPAKGQKGWSVPNGEKYRFKKGNVPPQKDNPELIAKIQEKRNALIARDRLRIKYGLPQISKLKL